MIKSSDLKSFFEVRESVNKSSFAREAGVTVRHLCRIERNESNCSPELSAKIRILFHKYGYYE